MRELAPLVQPILKFTKKNEVIVLSPTGILHAIPLHALEVEHKTPLLERNPVVYSASLSILRLCHLRRQQHPFSANPKAVVFGNPSEDREGGTGSANEIAQLFNVEAKTCRNATKKDFLQDINDTDFVLFHGHAHTHPSTSSTNDPTLESFLSQPQFTDNDTAKTPLDDCIEFANGSFLTAREIFEIGVRGHFTLIACGSGTQTIGIGDEPSGLISSLLVSGAWSVVGTLWPITDDDGRDFSKVFYATLLEGQRQTAHVNLAEAVRAAALHLRARESKNEPFHWASFVLHGCWF